jgi:hypothetical protein
MKKHIPEDYKSELDLERIYFDVKIKESELTNINKPNKSEPDKSAFKKETSDNTAELSTNKEQQIKEIVADVKSKKGEKYI